MIALRIDHLSKTYPPMTDAGSPVAALTDVNLEVSEAEFVVVGDPSGLSCCA